MIHNRRSSQSSSLSDESIRFFVVILFFIAGFLLVLWKLYSLQIVQGAELQQQAHTIRNASISIEARRGGIFMSDVKTGEIAPVALNTTLYTVFFDARAGVDQNGNSYGASESDFPEVAKQLTDILYTRTRFSECEDDSKKCPKGSVVTLTGESEDDIIAEQKPDYDEAKEFFEQNLLQDFLYKRESMIWATEVDDAILTDLESQAIPHLSISHEAAQVSINLIGLTDVQRDRIAEALVESFGGKKESIKKKLFSTRRGYIPVMHRVYPEELKKVQKLKELYAANYTEKLALYNKEYARYQEFEGFDETRLIEPKKSPFSAVGFENVPVRYYPENDLAAQVVGFVDSAGVGQYGIERSLDRVLTGVDGVISGGRDVNGNAVGISEEGSGKVTDGASVVLTIDRALQKKVEEILDARVDEFNADSGQIIVMNPKTGEILAMANSPRFNPNFYGEVYERELVEKNDIQSIYKTTPIEEKNEEGFFSRINLRAFTNDQKAQETDLSKKYAKDLNGNFIKSDIIIFKDYITEYVKENGVGRYYRYKNVFGPGVYINKIVMEIYEPGSVMKPLVMAAALEEGEITPQTRYLDDKPIEVGPYTIRNADNRYPGAQSMSNIMERSANVGMAFIARRMGSALMYQALKNFQFGEYTHILLPEELAGSVKYHKQWSEALLYTSSFGQGISMTPLQLVRAWTPLANGGYLVQPRVVKEVQFADGSIEKTEVDKKRIFSTETVEDMKTILIASVQKGVAKNGAVKGHYIAGKTGTSQIISANGGYESIEKGEEGNTITGFIGYAPVNNPEYLVYVKFDRPRKGIRDLAVFGSSTAAPTFAETMVFIFDYFDVPTDR